MPSFLERLTGLSFRAELLMMNILGLVNSTLDWSPLKWTNQLERIWNLSLSQQSLILDTIGEHTIKTILSWVVIARIIIAHVYTFTYVTNIYSILTWSRPNLLLPWMVLSFFKNVVLEVIVIVIGLLLWYEQRFSILLFLEFIVVKGVPLVLATYNWYSNSCLFLQLRRVEKMRRLRTTMRRDSDISSNRLARCRTKSLTTLLSSGTDDTCDSQDTMSLIIEDPTLTPAEKVMKLLGLTEFDIERARANVERRSGLNDKPAEMEETLAGGNKGELTLYYSMESEEEKGLYSTTQRKENKEEYKVSSEDKRSLFNKKGTLIQRIERLREMLRFIEKDSEIDRCAAMKKREAAESIESKIRKQMKISPLHSSKGIRPCSSFAKRGAEKLCSAGKQTKGSATDKTNCSPLKQEILFDLLNRKTYGQPRRNSDEAPETDASSESATVTCVCELSKLQNLRGKIEEGSTSYKTTLAPQAPTSNGTVRDEIRNQDIVKKDIEENMLREPQDYPSNIVNVKINSTVNQIDDDSRVSGKTEIDTKFQKEKYVPVRELLMEMCGKRNMVDVMVDPSTILQNLNDLGESSMLEMQKLMLLEQEDDGMAVLPEAVSLRWADVSESAGTEAGGLEKNDDDPYASDKEENASSLDISKDSLDDSNLPRVLKDSMKVFDRYYEKHYTKNTEFQSLLRQTAKKNWNFFVGHMNNKQSDGPSKKDSSDSDDCQDIFGNVRAVCSKSRVTRNREKLDRYEDLKPTPAENYLDAPRSKPQALRTSHYENLDVPLAKGKKTSRKFPKNTDPASWRKKFYSGRQNRQHSESTHVSLASNLNVDTDTIEPLSSLTSPSAASLKHSSSATSNGSRQAFWQTAETRRLPETRSSESVCRCKIQPNKTTAKSSKFEGNSNSMQDKGLKKNRKDTRKVDIESFRTVSLAQAARPSGFEKLTVRGKPPVPPRKTIPKKQDERSAETRTQKTDYAGLQNIMHIKSRKPIASIEDRRSREMKALRAYNAATLHEDKRRLTFKSQKTPLSTPSDFVYSTSKVTKRGQPAERYEKTSISREVEISYDDYLDKENLFAEASIGTDPSQSNSESSRSNSRSINKKSKIDKFTEISYDHLDRSQASQIKGEYERSRTTDETAPRKSTKYGRSNASIDNGSTLAKSNEIFEGLQNGRDLGRTPAKEDVRDHFPAPGKLSIISDRLYKIDTRDNFTSIEGFRNDRDDLILNAASAVTPKLPDEATRVFEKSVFDTDKTDDLKDNQDVIVKTTELIENQGKVSIDSPNVIEHEETKQLQPTIDGAKRLDTENSKEDEDRSLQTKCVEKENIASTEDSEIRSSKLENVVEDPLPSSASSIDDVEEKEELTKQTEESRNRTKELSRDYDRRPKRVPLDLREITRNIDKSYCLQGIILTNNNLHRENVDNGNQQEYQRRSIVDDSTVSALHVALSHKPQIIARSFLRDPPSSDAFSNIRNTIFDDNPQVSTSDGYSCHSNRDDALQDSGNSNQTESNRDTPIVIIDDDELPIDPGDITLVGRIDEFVGSETINDEQSRTCDILDSLNQLLQDDYASREEFEPPPEPSNTVNDEQRSVSSQSNIEREDESAVVEQKLKEDTDALPILWKQELFSDLRFPIAISTSDLRTTVMTSLNDYLEPSYVITKDVESVMTDMISSVTRQSHEEDESRKKDEKISVDILEDRCVDQTRVYEITERETVAIPPIQPSTISVADGGPKFPPLSSIEYSWDTTSSAQSNNNLGELPSESVDTNEIERAVVFEKIVSEETATCEDALQENESTLVRRLNNEKTSDNAENNNELECVSMKAMETTTRECDVAAAADEGLSVTMIVMFSIIVVFFYIRYLFNTVLSYATISRSTSTLRPFDIHTVSTSISRVFDERVAEETEDESSENGADTPFEESVRFKQIKIEGHKHNDAGSSLTNKTIGNTVREEQKITIEEIREKVEEVVQESAENSILDIEFPSTSTSNDINKIREIDGRSDTEIQETVIRSQDFCTLEPRCPSGHFLPNMSNATSNDDVSSTVLNTEGEIKLASSIEKQEIDSLISKPDTNNDQESSKSLPRNTPSKSSLDTFIRNLPPSEDKSDDRSRDLATVTVEIDEKPSQVQLPQTPDTKGQSDSRLNLNTVEECQQRGSEERIDLSVEKTDQREDSTLESNSVENDENQSTTNIYKPVLGPFFGTIVGDTDSYDTTYSRSSEMSEDTVSLKGGSTMEDFSTDDSINSITNNSNTESENLE